LCLRRASTAAAGKGDRAPARACLGRLEFDLASDALERLVHCQGSGGQVDVGPAQPQELAAPHAGGDGDEDREMEARFPRGVEQRGDLGLAEDPDLA
jgi:hypothetical protein